MEHGRKLLNIGNKSESVPGNPTRFSPVATHQTFESESNYPLQSTCSALYIGRSLHPSIQQQQFRLASSPTTSPELSARRLFPDLPGIDNAIIAYEVHAAFAAARATSTTNMYAVLAVGDRSPSPATTVSHDSLKLQYRRLCLMLHPDKNRSAAAEGAFRLLREAWDGLSRLHPPGYSAVAPFIPPPPPPVSETFERKRLQARSQQAEEASRRAEEFFLAGNIASAHRLARRANRLCPSLPSVANALAAYDVHAAAVANPDGQPDWYAVLGIDRSSSLTLDAIKKHFRRRSLLVHPDKNRSAAADGAFKLLAQACDTLSDRVNANANAGAEAEKQDWWSEYWKRHPKFSEAASRRRGAAADEEPTPRREREPPMVIYCKRCDREFVRDVYEFGVTCRRCHRTVRPPWERSKPSSPTKKPSSPKPELFPCPGQCPRCGTQFASMVSAGRWQLKCKACSKFSLVNVQGPDMASCTR
uniref:J domain-containing protein n=1 Tax=Leersia perrieri TaxID=77586 RepID=A0A0D9W155_9ORYZ